MGSSSDSSDQIDDQLYTPSTGGGVFSARRPTHDDRSLRRRSTAKDADVETASVNEKDDGVDERDFHKKQVFTGWQLAWLSYQSLGVIYGDIGTSPLYVFSSTFSDNPSQEDVLGAISLIIWALTIMVTIKYALIVLNADDEGEGGTFALYSLISRYANLIQRDPRQRKLVRIERYRDEDMPKPNRLIRSWLEKSVVVGVLFKVVGVFGVALLLADGVLTPAQSLLGAIQGITVVNSSLSSSTVVGVSCGIIVLVFLIQPFGTGKIANTFAPIVIIWMFFNLSFGIYNLVHYDASVFKAFSPYFAGSFLVRNRHGGWLQLGGILLAFTGVETLFADLGAFSKRAVQISWLFFVYPCLLISYIGQAAHMMVDPTVYANPFYLTVPPGMLYPSLIVAILACIVASQAVITGSFQLLSQIMKLSYFPQVEVVHTSKKFHGQVYIPLANWIMMIGTVIVTAVYTNTTALGEAYGSCVILVSFLTTCMVAIVAIIVWRLPLYIVFPVFIVFALWDGMFLSSALSKVPHGAWVTLMIAAVLTLLFVLWRYGKEQQWGAENSDNVPLSQTTVLKKGQLALQPKFGSSTIVPINGLGIFFDKAGLSSTTPPVFLHFLQKFGAAPDVSVFFHLRALNVPTVPPNERYTISRCFTYSAEDGSKHAIPNTFRLIVRHGYTDEVITPDLGILVLDLIREFLNNESPKSSSPSSSDNTMAIESAALQRAFTSQVIYIVGKEHLRIAPGTNIVKKLLLMLFLYAREVTSNKVQHLNVQADRVVEVGFVKDI
ncbi:potassium transporter, putative [Talaromyces stipitatus ATCC 10500]|uniref:Potassium transporter, putative n=1 Tax=Talaromyces stipitatus (strain ATCC 10500 / CBS 375.48 / QM 6759 / NRRL 1006) TaxID=441959 RepID=B8M9V0_TALSN|nr:potassium transporter, putative [Talaromyces stipitatus ATCC 10500]EED18102.1 potassium transporter, putative [Talaromyces stipitatus ATCC 10500]